MKHFLLLLFCTIALSLGVQNKANAQTVTGLTDVAGFSSIVSSTCTQANPTCLGLPDAKVLVNTNDSALTVTNTCCAGSQQIEITN